MAAFVPHLSWEQVEQLWDTLRRADGGNTGSGWAGGSGGGGGRGGNQFVNYEQFRATFEQPGPPLDWEERALERVRGAATAIAARRKHVNSNSNSNLNRLTPTMLFQAFDTDNDGRLSTAELRAGLRGLGVIVNAPQLVVLLTTIPHGGGGRGGRGRRRRRGRRCEFDEFNHFKAVFGLDHSSLLLLLHLHLYLQLRLVKKRRDTRGGTRGRRCASLDGPTDEREREGPAAAASVILARAQIHGKRPGRIPRLSSRA
jgi:hypothetical protein